jgi:hypothetical protein
MRHALSSQRQGHILTVVLLLLLLFLASCPALGQGQIYWAEPDNARLSSSTINGSDPGPVATGFVMVEPMEIDADELNGWLYWTDRSTGTISRSRPDGSEPNIVIANLHTPFGIALDAESGFLYWTEKSAIRRARLDGSEIVDLVTEFRWPQALEVFPELGFMFWTVYEGGTYRSELDGSNTEQIAAFGEDNLTLSKTTRTLYIPRGDDLVRMGLAGEDSETIVEHGSPIHAAGVEEGANRLCWSFVGGIACGGLNGENAFGLTATPGAARSIEIDPNSRMVTFLADLWPAKLMRCKDDGSGLDDLINHILGPTDIAVDPVAGKVYWIDDMRRPLVVSRSNLDGSSIEDIPITAFTGLAWGGVASVAVDPVLRRLYVGFYGSGLGYVGGIASGSLDGPVDTVVLGEGWDNIVDIVVGTLGDDLYYSSQERHLIGRIAEDGSAHYPVVSKIDPRGIALAAPEIVGHRVQRPRIFWVERGQDCTSNSCGSYEAKIRSANEDGSDVVDVLVGLSEPAYLGIDQHAAMMMWSDPGSGEIKRARLDGSDIQTIVATDTRITGIAAVSSPTPVTLLYPPSLANDLPTSFELRWSVSQTGSRSEVQVTSASSASDIVFALNTPHSSAWFDAPVAEAGHVWRVRVLGAGGVSSWTQWSAFSVGSAGPLAVTLIEPADAATDIPIETMFSWSPASDASHFRLQVAATSDFSTLVSDIDSLIGTSYTLTGLSNEHLYFWRVAGVSGSGSETFSQPNSFTTVIASPQAVGISIEPDGLPLTFDLTQNYPNPFNRSTTIRYDLPASTRVSLIVFDIRGRKVATLVDSIKPAGRHLAVFNALTRPSGLYLYHLTAAKFAHTRTMTLLR